MLAWEKGSGQWAGWQLAQGFHLGSLSAWPWPLALQINHGNRVRLYHITSGETLEDDTDYKGRLSLGQDKSLSISRVTMQDSNIFVCQVGAGSYGVDEKHTRLFVYSE